MMGNIDIGIVECTNRMPTACTLNSSGQSPAARTIADTTTTGQWQRTVQQQHHRLHSAPLRINYTDDSSKYFGSPGKENMSTEELSFYHESSPQGSPRPCSPCLQCPDDELLPSETTPGKQPVAPAAIDTIRIRRPLEDHQDPNSSDSGYGANSVLSGTGGRLSASRSHSMFRFLHPSMIGRHNSSSPRSAASSQMLLHSGSLSSVGSMESMDDIEMELFDMESVVGDDEDDENNVVGHPRPSDMKSLMCGAIKATKAATSPEYRRPTYRRCLSLIENCNTLSTSGPLKPSPMATPDRMRFSSSRIAHEQQENINFTTSSSYAARTEMTRCFKRPEPPGVSPIQCKRYKPTLDSSCISMEVATQFDSPAKTTVATVAAVKRPIFQKSMSLNDAHIMSALSRSSSEPDLIGDFSKSYILPLMEGRHRDLKSISVDTMASLVRGEYDDRIACYSVIDCRYPYEFDGGHIRGAKNFFSQDQILEELIKCKTVAPVVEGASPKRNIVVFHCEFSSERGPKLSRFLRNHDRIVNSDSYPALHYPEVYLLHGGYKEFFQAHADLCDPIAYRPMLDPEFGDAYRHFRAKSKSWNGDGTGTTVKATSTVSNTSSHHRHHNHHLHHHQQQQQQQQQQLQDQQHHSSHQPAPTGQRLLKSRSRLML